MSESVKPCMVCGKPVETKPDGNAECRALCDTTCMRIWCLQTDREWVSIGDYLERGGE